eukprot:TRINITY_DN589_c0_g1_i3.p1 TRINITY_DN589_c0_g1~~TRINITY_DN589_c0_g1_i3.p1  ORF type:complete len:1046 (-),score=216.92 TRINITY_DN589_c0_g1_i3:442-3336(-)
MAETAAVSALEAPAAAEQSGMVSVLDCAKFVRVSAFLGLESNRREVGLPTCIAVANQNILIGTSHGLVLVFDHTENLRLIIGRNLVYEYGPVTAVDTPPFAEGPRETWLLCGYQGGQVVLWDVLTGKALKVITDAHSHSVAFLRFLNDGVRVLSADILGVMRLHIFTTAMFFGHVSAERILVLNGKQTGSVLALEPLRVGNTAHVTDALNLFAFSTTKRTHIMGLGDGLTLRMCENLKLLRPQGTVTDSVSAATVAQPSALPRLSWRPAHVSEPRTTPAYGGVRQLGRELLDPVLAIAWGCTITFVTVRNCPSKKNDNPARLSGVDFKVGEYSTNAEITNIAWLGPHAIVFTTMSDDIRVLDPITMAEIQTTGIKHMELIYSARLMNPATQNPQISFENCIRYAHSRLYLLGLGSLHTVQLLSWDGCIESLVAKNRYAEALSLALDFYEGRNKCAIGLPKDLRESRTVVASKLLAVLQQFARMTLQVPSEAQSPRRASISVANLCIQYCLKLDASDILFGELFPLFECAGAAGQFVSQLLPQLLDGAVVALPDHIFGAVSDYCVAHGQASSLERLIRNMAFEKLNFQQVVSLCHAHRLYSTVLYLNARRMADLIAPLCELFNVFVGTRQQQHDLTLPWTSTPEQESLGKLLIQYIGDCLIGVVFQHSMPITPPSRVHSLRWELCAFMFARNIPEEAREYPRLFYLLSVDTAAVLHALYPVFETPSFAPKGSLPTTRYGFAPDRQQMSHVLTCLVLDRQVFETPTLFTSPSSARIRPPWRFTDQQQSVLLLFLAKYYAKHSIDLTDELVHFVISGYLCNQLVLRGGAQVRQDHEQILLSMLPRLLESNEPHSILITAEGAGFFAVAERIHLHLHEFTKAMTDCTKSPDNQHRVFDLVRQLLADQRLDGKDKTDIRSAVIANLVTLTKIDATKYVTAWQGIPRMIGCRHNTIHKETSAQTKLERKT